MFQTKLFASPLRVYSKTTLLNSSKRSFTKAANTSKPLKSGFFGSTPKIFLWSLGLGLGLWYTTNSRSAIHEFVICPLIRLVTPDAENGHKLGIWFLKSGLSPKLFFDKDPESLRVNVFGTTLTNPIGCAAGFDKNGEAIDGVLPIGFGFMEVGTVTPLPQPGNPKPRFFRLPQDDAVINRYGFNSNGHENMYQNLSRRVNNFLNSYFCDKKKTSKLSLYKDKLLAINLGKNKNGDEVQDYLKGIEKFQSLADVLVINVSSPNTPGLRDLQQEEKLTNLLSQIVAKRNDLISTGNALGAISHNPPILVKIAPDLSVNELKSIVESAKTSNIDGIIISNTTIQRPKTLTTEDEILINENGGLSGKPLKPLSLAALRTVSKYSKDSKLVLVGCGGISSGKDAIEFAKAGASFVELYTSFAYRGPGLIARIKDEIKEELEKEGKTWMEIIGQDNK
ncbi:hypothetical protein TBLA_0F01920 [Henningerozyma blattae CBS 6284]|uniref:Dihydroorotate dehydrogenase (quinone), mitochondrial n=1 Tax=Henningerozyma blattae (strain ATCC 34711 / CBS 6284 / DSM 70876 / NBRC 10599 / NRRL Y-10934 / UCD 77-7) TaxID=1071380 RepID=I2H5T2_HENB6|nr:hypothetical protein TBLA_0F01920 [Tetrapisispora blattae CBS 6284]CCH61734.1 hypothetical protein TBLA_0F01920 [Tetrapisispora blattae CBS 6284]